MLEVAATKYRGVLMVVSHCNAAIFIPHSENLRKSSIFHEVHTRPPGQSLRQDMALQFVPFFACVFTLASWYTLQLQNNTALVLNHK